MAPTTGHQGGTGNDAAVASATAQSATAVTSARQPLAHRTTSVIPEASEREELTVNETSNMNIDFPIEPHEAKGNKAIADKYLTASELTEVDDYEQLYYLCENE